MTIGNSGLSRRLFNASEDVLDNNLERLRCVHFTEKLLDVFIRSSHVGWVYPLVHLSLTGCFSGTSQASIAADAYIHL